MSTAGRVQVIMVAAITFTALSAGCSPDVPPAQSTTSATSTPALAATTPPATTPPPTLPADRLLGLGNATLNLPPRALSPEFCGGGPGTTFRRGRAGALRLLAARPSDVDRDGVPDAVASIACTPGEGNLVQVVAFRLRADGSFATIGLVVQNEGSTPFSPTEIQNVFGFEPTPSGEIRVEVGDYQTTYTDAFANPQGLHQIRTYRWNGRAFTQAAGSTSFVIPPGTLDLTVTASPMTYSKPSGGRRLGTLSVTIRNNGTTAVEDLTVQLLMGGDDPDRALCTGPGGPSRTCPVGRLGPGATKTITYRQSIDSSFPRDATDDGADLQVRRGDQRFNDIRGIPLVYK